MIWYGSMNPSYMHTLVTSIPFRNHEGVCFFSFLLKVICFQILRRLFFHFSMTYYKFFVE